MLLGMRTRVRACEDNGDNNSEGEGKGVGGI